MIIQEMVCSIAEQGLIPFKENYPIPTFMDIDKPSQGYKTFLYVTIVSVAD